MYSSPTVYILGAGASWHYGYPTGEGLVQRVKQTAQQFSWYLEQVCSGATPEPGIPQYVVEKYNSPETEHERRHAFNGWKDECDLLAQKILEVNPLIIDYFFALNQNLSEIGRFIISWVLIEIESQYRQRLNLDNFRASEYSANDWYRNVLHNLTDRCKIPSDLLKNDVTFITFNYDSSLEKNLSDRLLSMQLFANDPNQTVQNFLARGRTIHVYGGLRKGTDGNRDKIIPGAVLNPNVMREKFSNNANSSSVYSKLVLDTIYEASRDLRTIEPDNKGNDSDSILRAREAIRRAKYVYILGYGFDENNNRQLDLYNSLRLTASSVKYILFTNLNDLNLINKRASLVFFGATDNLLAGGTSIVRKNSISPGYTVEKSIRNVIGALSSDFHTPDEQSLAG